MRVLMLDRFNHTLSPAHAACLAGALNQQGIKTALSLSGCPEGEQERWRQYCRRKAPLVFEEKYNQIYKTARHYQVKLIHVHAAALLPLARQLAGQLRLPYGITAREAPPPPAAADYYRQASFIIVTNPVLEQRLAKHGRAAAFIPEGVDLDEYQPTPRGYFRIAFIGEEGCYTGEGYRTLLKAAGLADLPVEVICAEQAPLLKGTFHGWPPGRAAVLQRTQVVAGSGRGLVEGMACGNAALLIGRSYHGILQPQTFNAGRFPDLSGGGTIEPCYRSIFFDLSQLLKDRPFLSTLQHWGRKFARENCDLRLAAEATARLYEKAL